MKIEPSPDIVEMIDDDDFTDRSTDLTVTDTRGRWRWAGPAVVAAVIAVIGYGVVSSAIESDPTNKSSTPGLIDPQYYVAEPPPGFTLYLAEDRDQTGAAQDHFIDSGPAQLWATKEATATRGSWFVVSQGRHHATGRNAYRTLVDGVEVVIERDPSSRQSRVSFTKNGTAVEITAFGWLDRQLVRLVRSVSIDDSVINFSNDFFTTDHRRLLDVDPAVALLGLPVARVEYATDAVAPLADRFTITVSGDNVVNRPTVTEFALAHATEFRVGGHPAVVGDSVADPAMSIVQWRDGDKLITVSGNIDPERLQAIAATVHRSSDDAVRKQLVALSSANTSMPSASQPIATGQLPDGSGWAVRVSPPHRDDTGWRYLWWFTQPDDSNRPTRIRPSLPSGGPTIETFVEEGRTYVVAKVPRSMSGAELHVNRTGLPAIVTPFLDVDPDLPDEFAAAVFVEPVSFAVQILDHNRTQVAFWPDF